MKRCPFGGEIEAQIAATGSADVCLYAGDPAHRWTRALARRALVGPASATLLPPGIDPLALRWPAGTCIADVSGQSAEIVRALAQALVRDGVTHALLVDLENPARTLHVKPQPQQVAA